MIITDKKEMIKAKRNFMAHLAVHGHNLMTFCNAYEVNYTNLYYILNRSPRINQLELDRLKKLLK